MKPRLLVVCLDGATPRGVRAHGLGRHGAWSPLRSVYPSSTAPAHASMWTGVAPSAHGVVGNRYWDADTDDVVGRAHGDPVATLHPYERGALACPSLLDTLERAGLRWAALMFPHTFTRAGGPQDPAMPAMPAAYTLYAPTEDRRFADVAGRIGRWPIAVFGESARLELAQVEGALHARCADPRVTIRARGPHELDVLCLDEHRALAFALAVHDREAGELVIRRKTATLVLCFGGLRAGALCHATLPHSAQLDYSADRGHAFYECPSIAWTTAAAQALLATDPDVLFVRYNQIDHAQEHLYGLARRGDEAAGAQLAMTYARVDAGLWTLRQRVGLDCPMIVFSDHGIDAVHAHVRPNALLAELGLADRFVFQGDSSCAYLYPARPDVPLAAPARAALVSAVSAQPELWVAADGELAELGCHFPARQGLLTVRSRDGVELQYGPGPLRRAVCSASHGFGPDLAAMHGVFLSQNLPRGAQRPTSITQLRPLIESLLT